MKIIDHFRENDALSAWAIAVALLVMAVALTFALILVSGMVRAPSVQVLASIKGVRLTYWQAVFISPSDIAYATAGMPIQPTATTQP